MHAAYITQTPGDPPVVRGEQTFTITQGQDLVDLSQGIHLTFTDTQITLTLNTSGGPFILNGSSFLGVEIELLAGPAFTNVTIDPSSAPELANGVVFDFDADSLNFDFSASCGTPGCPNRSELVFNVATAVPEPASLALLGTGLAGFAALRRRRKS